MVKPTVRMRASSSPAAGMHNFDAALRAWAVDYQDADGDLRELDAQRAMGYQLAKENPIAIGALNTQVTNVIGTGLRLQASVDRDYLQRKYSISTEELDKWETARESNFRGLTESLDCDLERQQTFYDLQALMLRTELAAGDSFAPMPYVRRRNSPYGIKIQPIDPARISNENNAINAPQLAGGIQRDRRGAVVAYHVRDSHPYTTKGDNKFTWTKIQAFGRQTGRRNMIHMFNKTNVGVSASRGRPVFAPLVKTLKQLGRYTDAELMAAVIQSFFTVFVQTEDGAGLTHGNEDNSNVEVQANDFALGMGNIIDLAPNEKIEMAKADRPNAGFDGFMMSMLRQIGMTLNIPYEVLIKHFQSSYSAARAAMLEYWKAVREMRQHCAMHFCQIYYENWLAEEIAIGRAEAPGFFTDPMARLAWSGAFWIGPPRGMIDPVKEVAAELDLNEAALKTKSDISMELLGKDWDSTFHRWTREKRMLEAEGITATPGRTKEILAQPPEPVEED